MRILYWPFSGSRKAKRLSLPGSSTSRSTLSSVFSVRDSSRIGSNSLLVTWAMIVSSFSPSKTQRSSWPGVRNLLYCPGPPRSRTDSWARAGTTNRRSTSSGHIFAFMTASWEVVEDEAQPLPPTPSPARRGGEEEECWSCPPLSASGRGLGGGVLAQARRRCEKPQDGIQKTLTLGSRASHFDKIPGIHVQFFLWISIFI